MIKMNNKNNNKKDVLLIIVIVLVVLHCIAAFLFFMFCFPYKGSNLFKKKTETKPYDYELSQEEALRDFDFAYNQLKRIHPAMHDKTSSEFQTITAAYSNERNIILTKEKVSVVNLTQSIERIFSILGDAHTFARITYDNPLYLKYVPQKIYDGFEFKAVNGISYEDLLQQKKEFYSFESEEWAMNKLTDDSVSIHGLAYLGFSTDSATYVFEKTIEEVDENNVTHPKKLLDFFIATKDDYVPYSEYVKIVQDVKSAKAANDQKQNQEQNQEVQKQSAQESLPFCYYKIDEEHNLAVLTLTSCINDSFYNNCLKQMFTEIKQKNIKNVAVDVRKNSGGSSLVINNFFKYLDIPSYYESTGSSRFGPFILKANNGYTKNRKHKKLLFDGNVFVLTSTLSFSSAMMFPQYVKDNGIGKVIGETPANNPNGYGDIVSFNLPYSKIFMQISFKQFHRINQNTSEKYVEPDYPCDSNKVFEVLYELIDSNAEIK